MTPMTEVAEGGGGAVNAGVCPVVDRKPRTRASRTTRKLAVAALTGAGHSQAEISAALAVNERTVRRDCAEVKTALAEHAERLAEFRELVEAEMPAKWRARRLKELASQNAHSPTALKALEHAHDLLGLNDGEPQAGQPVALFTFPPGSRAFVAIE